MVEYVDAFRLMVVLSQGGEESESGRQERRRTDGSDAQKLSEKCKFINFLPSCSPATRLRAVTSFLSRTG